MKETVPLTITMVDIREEKGLPYVPIPMMISERDPRIEKVPPTQTNSINTGNAPGAVFQSIHPHPVP